MTGRHAGEPEPRPWAIYLAVGVTVVLFVAVGVVLLVRGLR